MIDKTKTPITEHHIQCLEMVNNLKVLKTNEKEFVSNLTDRYASFGMKTVITKAQEGWLEDLADRYIAVYQKWK